MGRVVITHSTYLEGLINILKKLANDSEIKTITPGVIKRTKSKRESLEIKVTVKTRGGYKAVVRKGKSVQEVFIITKYKKEELQKKINLIFIKSQ